MAYQILLVEDDSQICEVICDYFQDKSEGEMIIHAYDNAMISTLIQYHNLRS